MKHWFKTYTVESEKNGSITVQWRFGTLYVYAGGFEQSGPYDAGLWRQTFKKLSGTREVKKILLLGLGGGNAIPHIEKSFPGAHLTVVEWDEAMVGIAREANQWKKEPTIVVGDACDVLRTARDTFDLILIDVFFADQPEPRFLEASTIEHLKRALTPKGLVVMNLSRKPEFISAIGEHIPLREQWVYKQNTVAVFGAK